MRPGLLFIILSLCAPLPALAEEAVRVSLGEDLFALVMRPEHRMEYRVLDRKSGVVLVDVPTGAVDRMMAAAHEELGRCGGFMYESKATTNALGASTLGLYSDIKETDS